MPPTWRLLAEVEPDQVAQQMGVGLRHVVAVVGLEQRRDAGSILCLATSMLSLSAISQPPGEDVAQQAIGLALRLRVGAALEDRKRSGRASVQFSNS